MTPWRRRRADERAWNAKKNKAKFIDVIYTHAEGEPTCIVHGGTTYSFGLDIIDKRRVLERNYDWVRRARMRAPRGNNDIFGVFVTLPSGPGS